MQLFIAMCIFHALCTTINYRKMMGSVVKDEQKSIYRVPLLTAHLSIPFNTNIHPHFLIGNVYIVLTNNEVHWHTLFCPEVYKAYPRH